MVRWINKQTVVEHVLIAIADEWCAHYQYWIGSIIVGDSKREDVLNTLVEHSGEEYDHATELAAWIKKYGNDSRYLPVDMCKTLAKAYCGYTAPTGLEVERILCDNIEGEKCAIKFYTRLWDYAIGADGVGNILDMLDWILEEERKHLAALERLQRGG
jgi:bacterioferritin